MAADRAGVKFAALPPAFEQLSHEHSPLCKIGPLRGKTNPALVKQCVVADWPQGDSIHRMARRLRSGF
jgi:hypothetical protein